MQVALYFTIPKEWAPAVVAIVLAIPLVVIVRGFLHMRRRMGEMKRDIESVGTDLLPWRAEAARDLCWLGAYGRTGGIRGSSMRFALESLKDAENEDGDQPRRGLVGVHLEIKGLLFYLPRRRISLRTSEETVSMTLSTSLPGYTIRRAAVFLDERPFGEIAATDDGFILRNVMGQEVGRWRTGGLFLKWFHVENRPRYGALTLRGTTIAEVLVPTVCTWSHHLRWETRELARDVARELSPEGRRWFLAVIGLCAYALAVTRDFNKTYRPPR